MEWFSFMLSADSNKGLVTSLLRYAEARGLLLSLEAQEAVQQVLRYAILTAIGAVLVFTGWLLVAAGLTGLIMEKTGWSWVQAVLVLGGGHVILALILFTITLVGIRSARWFADSINEFQKDRTWLAKQTEKP